MNTNQNTDEAKKDFFKRVYEIVRLIPHGQVTTYGYIGEALGMKSSARMVGWALNAAADDTTMPCHRVVNRLGELSGKRFFATPTLMHDLLVAEGVEFNGDCVVIEKHLWKPVTEIRKLEYQNIRKTEEESVEE